MPEQSQHISQNRGRLRLLALLLIFALPVIAAHLILNQGWYQAGVTNKGVLIEPRFTFQDANQQNPRQGEWQLAFVVPEVCGADCQQRWHMLNQSHIALGAYSERVEVMLYVSDVSDQEWLEAQEADIHQVTLDQVPIAEQDYVLIDPLGQWVMRYSSEVPDLVGQNKGLISDVRKILKLSRVG